MRHLLLVTGPRAWELGHPLGWDYADDHVDCLAVLEAAEVFMTPNPEWAPPAPLKERMLARLFGPLVPVGRGVYWCDLGDDGNLHIGGRLSPVDTLLQTGILL